MNNLSGRAAAVAVVGLLAACGQKGGAAGPPGQAAAPTAQPGGGADVQLNFADLPKPRAGLWRTTIDNGQGHVVTDTHCLSGQQPNISREPNLGKPGSPCSQFTIKKTFLGAIVVDANCSNGAFTMTSHAVATGDFSTNMSSDSQMTMAGPNLPSRTVKVHSEAHWLGPCPPGQSPSDEPSSATG